MSTAVRYLLVLVLLPGLPFGSKILHPQTVPVGFEVIDLAIGLDNDVVGFALLPDNRILLIHQFSGEVKLLVNGLVKAQPLLVVPNLAGLVEKGLLGIAVDPDFPEQPYIYLFYTYDGDPDSNRVSRFTLEGDLVDPDSDNLSIDPASQLTLIDDMPANSNSHNGGTIRFAKDKTLLISHGDDKNKGQVQSLDNLKGKILRIHRDGTIPEDNPVFPNEPSGKRHEIFAFGLRNPFRFTVDPETGQLFIGDVGQSSNEEIDLAAPVGGENFGWPRYEGTLDFDTSANLIPPSPTFPVWEYHLTGANSVIALVAYRQQNFPNDFSFPNEYDGTLFYADFYDDVIHNLRPDGSGGWTSVEFASGFANNPVDGALANDGSILILEYGSALRKIVFTNNPVSVELSFFEASVATNRVILTWGTSSESNNYGFEVQRSISGRKFRKIAFVKGNGNSTQTITYTYEDANPGVGNISYRLKQIDTDGTYEYSSVLRIEITLPQKLVLMQNYPNPFNATTKIFFYVPDVEGAKRKIGLVIFDMQGREVKELVNEYKSPGTYAVTWDGANATGKAVASGIYVYVLKFDLVSQPRKLIYLR